MELLRVEVMRLVPMKLSVMDAKSQPVGNLQILVITPGNYRNSDGSEEIRNPRREVNGVGFYPKGTTFDTEIYRATTDAAGQCIVYGIAGRKDLVLRLVRPGGKTGQRVTAVAFGAKQLSRRIRFELD